MIKALCSVLVLVSIIVLVSITSLLYTVDFQLKVTELSKNAVGNEGREFLNYILSHHDILRRLSKSNILALSPKAFLLAQYLPSLWRINLYRHVLGNLRYPNLFLTICSSFNASCSVIYGITDVKHINSSSILWYLINLARVSRVGNYRIFFLPYMVPPSPRSNVCLIFKDFNENIKFISMALSRLGVNYTQVYYLDINSLHKCNWLVFPSNQLFREMLKLKLVKFPNLSNTNMNTNVIVLNPDGSYNGKISNLTIINVKKNLYFINIFPLSTAYKDNLLNLRDYINILTEALGHTNIPKGSQEINTNIDFVSMYKITLKDLMISGNITIKPISGSIIVLPCENTEPFIIMQLRNNNSNIDNMNMLIIKASRLAIRERYGYYALLDLHNATIISKYPLELLMVKNNGSIRSEVKSNVTRLGDVQLLLRGFELEANGNISLFDIYTFKELYSKFSFTGENVKVCGSVRVSLIIFDSYIAGTTLWIDGAVKNQRNTVYDYEIDINFLIYVVIPSVIIATFILILRECMFKCRGWRQR